MNFFEQQEQARKLSFRLIGLMLLSLTTLIILTTLVISIFIYIFQNHSTSADFSQLYNQSFITYLTHLVQSTLFLWIAIGVTVFVFMGSVYKHMSLRQGGSKIAMTLGGKLLQPDTQDVCEKRLLNIVEEMAIASGLSIPDIFILPEEGINAFAAGHNSQAAVIGVTQGCIELLSRDELQGVIAHEYSHIQNGDMRLNLHLVSILHGILLIGLIGQLIVRSSFSQKTHTYKFNQNKRKTNGRLIFLGFALSGIGYGGTLFGNLIKAAVSRQREFLADASAVQFTRNPNGLGGALNKIALHHAHSDIQHPRSIEFSHMYFAKSQNSKLNLLFATHPPIQDRLSKLFPAGVPRFSYPEVDKSKINQSNAAKKDTLCNKRDGVNLDVDDILNPKTLGTITVLEQAIQLIENKDRVFSIAKLNRNSAAKIPDEITSAAHNAYSARAVIYGLCLGSETDTQKNQIRFLNKYSHPRTFNTFKIIYPKVLNIDVKLRFTLLELCIPSLSNLSTTQDSHFKFILKEILTLNSHPELFEWCVYQRITNHNVQTGLSSLEFNELLKPTATVLACIADLTIESEKQKAFFQGFKSIWPEYETIPKKLTTQLDNELDINEWSLGLTELRKLKPLARPVLLKAIAKVIEYDKDISQNELDCFRLVGSILDCPIPKLTIDT